MIFNVLDAPRGRLEVLFGHLKHQSPLWLVYFNTVVAPNVQLGWFMRFAMECLIPYPLAFNSIWLGEITI